MSHNIAYKRVLLKLSGEALGGDRGYGIDPAILEKVSAEIEEIYNLGIQIAIVIGGGNIFRGITAASTGLDRVTGDTVGMLATLINSILLKESLQKRNIATRVLSAFKVERAAEYYIPRRAINHLEHNRVIIVAGGTGNPYFTTDTAAALRCAEIQCDVFLKATKVDGIYDADPVTHPDAKKINELTHAVALNKNIRVMDLTAFSLCMENAIPIIVFKLLEKGNLRKCIEGQKVGSIVKKGD